MPTNTTPETTITTIENITEASTVTSVTSVSDDVTETQIATGSIPKHIIEEYQGNIPAEIAAQYGINVGEAAAETAVTIPDEEIAVSDTDISFSDIQTETVTETEVTSDTLSETLLSEETISETEITSVSEAVTSAALIEEETIETTAATEAATIIKPQTETPANDYSNLIFAGIAALCIVGALFMNKGKKSSDVTAKQRDNERINKKKKEEREKKAKEKGEKKKRTLPKTVRDTLPYKKILAEDIWLIEDKKYSKVYKIDDINYNLGNEDQQDMILENYCTFLNTLDETVVCQISIYNSAIDVKENEKDIVIAETEDKYNERRREYNDKVLRHNLRKGNNAIRKSIYVTMTIEAPDEVTAQRRFNSIDLTIKNSFDHIGSTQLRPLSNQERVEMLKNFFINAEYKIPEFTAADYAKGIEKTYIAPDYFEFKKDYFMFGNYYCKTVFIKEYPNNATDNLLNELAASNLKLIITSNILAYDTPKARKLVQRQIGAITGDMGQREAKAAKAGYFSQQMPIRIKNQLDSYKELYDMISIEDEKLFLVNTIIMVQTEDYEELTNAMELVNSILKRNGFAYSEMMWQQEDGLCDALAVGSQRRFQWNRSLPTESIGIFVPFNVKEVQQKNSVYYGLNKLSNNMIMFNRIKSLINPAGFILGCPGGGKSFSAKREMIDVYLRYPESEIIIIDPEREYPAITNMFDGQTVKIATSSKNFINPFDFDFALLNDNGNDEDSYDVIKEKSQLLTSFIACMYTNRALTPQEVSFIDRCVRITYHNSRVLETLNKDDMPVLGDLFEVMTYETENVDPDMKRDMLATLEMYVGEGSANYFNNRTNVDIYNRLVSFDIKDLSGVLKTQAMLLVLDNIWNRLSANRDRKIPTWIYCDEIHVLFSNAYCLDFFRGLYKRARKYGGVLTGITQNVTDLLRDADCCTMLSNSEYLYLLKQSPADSLKLQEVMNFTDSELFYVNNVNAGEGLMVLGGKDKIPFYDKFPRDTELYKSMSTNFSETQALIKQTN